MGCRAVCWTLLYIFQIYSGYVWIQAHVGLSQDAHFLFYKEFPVATEDIEKFCQNKTCNECTTWNDYSRYDILDRLGGITYHKLFDILALEIDSWGKAFFFKSATCNEENGEAFWPFKFKRFNVFAGQLYFTVTTLLIFFADVSIWSHLAIILVESFFFLNAFRFLQSSPEHLKVWHCIDLTFFGLQLTSLAYLFVRDYLLIKQYVYIKFKDPQNKSEAEEDDGEEEGNNKIRMFTKGKKGKGGKKVVEQIESANRQRYEQYAPVGQGPQYLIQYPTQNYIGNSYAGESQAHQHPANNVFIRHDPRNIQNTGDNTSKPHYDHQNDRLAIHGAQDLYETQTEDCESIRVEAE